MTVYNEGQKAGRATKIVDQLPTGLKMKTTGTVTSSKGNSYTVAYDETTNKAIFTTAGTKDLVAYSGNTLDSDTIEIECTVTATANTSSAIVLTNVAWISEEYDSVDKTTITNQKGSDRDSEPSTVPSVNKDNMSDYTGNNNKSDLSDSSYYYKGQQDDDDFEKLVLKPKTFDLRLIKRIVEVNGTKVPERLLGVDVSKLANGTATTADYERDKDPVSVKNGDIVKYTLRVYNEGEIDGYASEISEDIPEGLEFMWSENKGNELDSDTTLTQAEKDAIKYNQGIWDMKKINDDTHKVELIATDYLAKGKGAEIATDGANLIKAFEIGRASCRERV